MLARGADRCGNVINIAPPEADFHPRSLAIFDEIRSAHAQVMMKDASKQASKQKGLYA